MQSPAAPAQLLAQPAAPRMFADLRVLGKAEFKALLKWREAVRVEMGLEEAAFARAEEALAAAQQHSQQ